MRLFSIALVAALSLASRTASAQSTNDWLVLPGVRVGPITRATTRADLVGIFGPQNVADQDIALSDAGPEPGTLVYKERPGDSIAIPWGRDKPAQRIQFLVLCPPELHDSRKPCRWHTRENIRFGTTLKELERLNGRPFTVLGFAWDYEGTVTSWNGGVLEKRLNVPCGGLGIRVNGPLGDHPDPTAVALMKQLSGDKPFSSSDKAMQKLNPQVTWMNVRFESCAR